MKPYEATLSYDGQFWIVTFNQIDAVPIYFEIEAEALAYLARWNISF